MFEINDGDNMKNLKLYCINNCSGVDVKGLKNSVYDILDYCKENNKSIEILEENEDIKSSRDSLKNYGKVIDISNKIFKYANKIINQGFVPLAFGSDHSMAIGSVSASANCYDNIGLVWVDAHSDINTEETSPSGNIHGMPVSFLLGEGNDIFSNIGNFKPKIRPENIVYIGLRSVDPGEVDILKKLGIKTYYYTEVEKRGLAEVVNKAINDLSDCKNIHLSFDFDSMNPKVFPAVSIPVENGFNQEDVLYIFEKFILTDKIISIDIVEYNRDFDRNGVSLAFAKELLEKIEYFAKFKGSKFSN